MAAGYVLSYARCAQKGSIRYMRARGCMWGLLSAKRRVFAYWISEYAIEVWGCKGFLGNGDTL